MVRGKVQGARETSFVIRCGVWLRVLSCVGIGLGFFL